MKPCSKCGIEKPLSEFYAQKDCKDGRRPDCKDCVRGRVTNLRVEQPDRAREIEAARYQRHRAQRKQKSHDWYHANAERGRESRRAYYEKNRENWERYRAKRNAVKRAAEHQPYTRREIYERDGGKCKICLKALEYAPRAFQLDHIVPLSLGGADTPANLQLTCPPCNRSKWNRLEGQTHFAT